MAKLPTELNEFIASLNSANVEYLIVGAHAVAFHGYPRYTGDFDFWIGATPENAVRVAKALAVFGFPQFAEDPTPFTQAEKILQIGRPPNRIDILTSVTGLEFAAVWSKRIEAKLDTLAVFYIDRASLIQNKRATGRPKDLADVAELTKIDPSV